MSAARTGAWLEALGCAVALRGPLLAWQRCLRELVGIGAEERQDARGLARALDELRIVHRAEQVALLQAASALRECSDGDEAAALAAWRARAREELRLAREDGFEAVYLLQECVLRSRDRWRPPAEIAREAQRLAREPRGIPPEADLVRPATSDPDPVRPTATGTGERS